MIRGQDKDGQVRFFAITTKHLVEKKRKAQNYSPIATAAIGRLMSAALMMGSMLKNDDERISIQIKGEGPMGGIVASSQTVDSFQRFSSLAIRVPRECRGIGRHLLSRLRENRRKGTLILSPPGGGKTTLLRDLIRGLSDSGVRVGVADERNEISASDEFDAGFDLGSHTDVLNGMPRAEGAMLLLRTMNPELIAVDEITREDDVEAIGQLAGCGVGILASAHAQTPQQMLSRPLYRSLLEGAFFTDAICITGAGANRQYRWERIES